MKVYTLLAKIGSFGVSWEVFWQFIVFILSAFLSIRKELGITRYNWVQLGITGFYMKLNSDKPPYISINSCHKKLKNIIIYYIIF